MRSKRVPERERWKLVAQVWRTMWAQSPRILPTYLLTVVPLPWFRRYRDQPQVRAFVAGATAAATGAIAGAVVVLGQRAIMDLPTVLVALASLGVLWRWRVPKPLLIVVVGLVGVGLRLALGRAA